MECQTVQEWPPGCCADRYQPYSSYLSVWHI